MRTDTDLVRANYRRLRAHQLATYGNSRLYVDGVDQRQHTGGGAAYGQHALAAYCAARLLARHGWSGTAAKPAQAPLARWAAA